MRYSERIVNALYRLVTGGLRVKTLLTPVGATIFVSFVLLLIFMSRWTDRIVKFPELPAPACMLLSLPLLTGGIFLMSWSILHFLKAGGTPVPVNPPPTLVSSGPYAYVRNPMLSGIFFLLFGLGFLTGSFSLTFIYTPLFILLMVIELKKVEEPELEKRFGAEYRAYRNSVPMFIPGQKGRRPEEKNKSGVKNP